MTLLIVVVCGLAFLLGLYVGTMNAQADRARLENRNAILERLAREVL